MTKLKIEPTTKEEQETFIRLDEDVKELTITTTTTRVFNKMLKKLGKPHQIFDSAFKPKDEKTDIKYISGASWTYDFFNNREEIKKVLSITNIIPKKKDTTDNNL